MLLLKLVFAAAELRRPAADAASRSTTRRWRAIDSLEARMRESEGTDAILLRFRLESSRAVDALHRRRCSRELEPVARTRLKTCPEKAQWALTRKGWELREGPLASGFACPEADPRSLCMRGLYWSGAD